MESVALRILGPEGAAMVNVRCPDHCHRILLQMPAHLEPQVTALPPRGTYTVTGGVIVCGKCHRAIEVVWREAA